MNVMQTTVKKALTIKHLVNPEKAKQIHQHQVRRIFSSIARTSA
jgi:hypothetical protein